MIHSIEAHNPFHNTRATVRVLDDHLREDHGILHARLSPFQHRRLERALCGVRGCLCDETVPREYSLDGGAWRRNQVVIVE